MLKDTPPLIVMGLRHDWGSVQLVMLTLIATVHKSELQSAMIVSYSEINRAIIGHNLLYL